MRVDVAMVGEAAVRWDRARREAAELRATRASFRCEHEAKAEYDDSGRCTAEADPCCWKCYRFVGGPDGGDERPLEQDEWCAPCRERQQVHEAYRQKMRQRGALMRALQRKAGRAAAQRMEDERA